MESNIILYTSNNGEVSIQVQYEDGTFWLTQKRMADLFGVDVRTINEHLRNLYKSTEIQEDRTIRKIRIVQTEGKREVEREVTFYHLDAIIAVIWIWQKTALSRKYLHLCKNGVNCLIASLRLLDVPFWKALEAYLL